MVRLPNFKDIGKMKLLQFVGTLGISDGERFADAVRGKGVGNILTADDPSQTSAEQRS